MKNMREEIEEILFSRLGIRNTILREATAKEILTLIIKIRLEDLEEVKKTIPHHYCESETMRDNSGRKYPCNCGVQDYIEAKLKEVEK